LVNESIIEATGGYKVTDEVKKEVNRIIGDWQDHNNYKETDEIVTAVAAALGFDPD